MPVIEDVGKQKGRVRRVNGQHGNIGDQRLGKVKAETDQNDAGPQRTEPHNDVLERIRDAQIKVGIGDKKVLEPVAADQQGQKARSGLHRPKDVALFQNICSPFILLNFKGCGKIRQTFPES